MLERVTEGAHAFEFLLSEANGARSRQNIVIAASQTLVAGAVLGAVLLGAATVTAGATVGTGTGSIGTVTADAGAPAGVYQVVIIEPGSNAGTFEVFKPDGTLDGTGTVAVAYNGSINFTLADATDFVAGDHIPVTVAYAVGSLQYKAVAPTATDGTQTAAAILGDAVTTGAGETAAAAAIVRDAEVIEDRMDFGSLTTDQQAAAVLQLAALGIVAR